MSRVIVVGAGVNGVTAAIELKKRGHEVVLLDPGPLPHPLAASTDNQLSALAIHFASYIFTVDSLLESRVIAFQLLRIASK